MTDENKERRVDIEDLPKEESEISAEEQVTDEDLKKVKGGEAPSGDESSLHYNKIKW